MDDINNSIETKDEFSTKWVWSEVSRNPNLTIGFLKDHFDNTGWDWSSISRNPGITIKDTK